MTEADLQVMHGASPRRRRLYAVACCRRIASALPDDRCRTAVEVAERYADGLVGDEELSSARAGTQAVLAKLRADTDPQWQSQWTPTSSAAMAADDVVAPDQDLADVVYYECDVRAAEVERALAIPAIDGGQQALWEDLFGAPSPGIGVKARWLAPALTELARSIYEARAFDQMPELAAALRYAGCGDEAILAHCQRSAPHARGCWLLDLLMGRQ